MAAQRRAAGKRWAASRSVELYDADGRRLPSDDDGTWHKAKVRWRVDGEQRKATFKREERDELRLLLTELQAAYEHDWAADERGWPVAPLPLPGIPAPAGDPGDDDVAEPADEDSDASARVLPGAGAGSTAIRDIRDLAQRFYTQRATTRSPKTGSDRSPITLKDYRLELDFVVEVLVYPPDDPRLDDADAEAGDPLRVDDPEIGVSPRDLLRFLEIRERTNRNIRSSNEAAMASWTRQVKKEEDRAAKEGRAPDLPPPPTLEPERASSRTVESVAKLVKSMFEEAASRGWIDYQPWTRDVDDRTISSAATRYTTKQVHRREQVDRIVAALGDVQREIVLDGRWVTVDGQRYQAMVQLGGYKGPRPQELIAIRRSWLELDRHRPRLVLRNALSKGRVVPLKHRRVGEVRYVYLDDEPDLVAALREHLERFVPEPDPESDDPLLQDPYVFLTHQGALISLKHFGDRWYKPAVRSALDRAGEEQLAQSTFKLLRASAVTHWLAEKGWTIQRSADQAGNRIEVIEKHYAGVLSEIGYEESVRVPAEAPPVDASELPDQLTDLPATALTELIQLASSELAKRSGT